MEQAIASLSAKDKEEDRVKRKIEDFKNIENSPEPLYIEGLDKPLTAIMDNYVGNWIVKNENQMAYRQKWEEFLPLEVYNSNSKKCEIHHKSWSVAYLPQMSLRKTHENKDGKMLANNYFVIGKNTARDDRPQTPVPQGEDLLQKNVLDREMIIGDGGKNFGFFITPNGFPYHKYASLLISKQARPQENVTEKDLEDFIKFSFMTKQIVFFNSLGAGASRPERFHAQVVDPEALHYEGNTLIHPISNKGQAKRIPYMPGIDELTDFPTQALIFYSREAPRAVSRVIERVEEAGLPYNLIIRGKEVYVVPRCRGREISHCIGKKIGGYEVNGVILVGNIEEPGLGQFGLEKLIHADDVFNELDYETVFLNVGAACLPAENLKGWIKGSKKR